MLKGASETSFKWDRLALSCCSVNSFPVLQNSNVVAASTNSCICYHHQVQNHHKLFWLELCPLAIANLKCSFHISTEEQVVGCRSESLKETYPRGKSSFILPCFIGLQLLCNSSDMNALDCMQIPLCLLQCSSSVCSIYPVPTDTVFVKKSWQHTSHLRAWNHITISSLLICNGGKMRDMETSSYLLLNVFPRVEWVTTYVSGRSLSCCLLSHHGLPSQFSPVSHSVWNTRESKELCISQIVLWVPSTCIQCSWIHRA